MQRASLESLELLVPNSLSRAGHILSPVKIVLEQRADQLCVDLAAKIARQIEEEEKQAVADSVAVVQPATAAAAASRPEAPTTKPKPSRWSVDYSRFEAISNDEDDSSPNQAQVKQIAHSLAGVVEDVKRLLGGTRYTAALLPFEVEAAADLHKTERYPPHLGSTSKASKGGVKVGAQTRRERIQAYRAAITLGGDMMRTLGYLRAQIDLQKAEELEFVIKIIFGKALVEPHYCETYADMVFALRTRYPEFPAENEGEKPHSFTRVLLNTVQNEFESLPTTFEPTDEDRKKFESTEDLNLEMKKRKGKMLANMKFIGNLFLRQLLAVKVIGQVVHDLIGIKQGENPLPEEHMIECVCELLQAIGYTLDETQQGESLMNSFAARLKDLSGVRNNGKHAYSKRIQFQIDGLLELRKNKWMKKLFKEQAKTKNAVREEAEREQRQHGRTVGPDNMFSVQTVGVRPAYMDEISAAKKRTKQVDAGASKPKFDKQYVKKICQYYGEDQQGDTLQEDWSKAQPTKEETKQGLEWLLETGFDDPNKQDVTAQVMVELVRRRLIPWDMLKDSLTNSLASLPDMKMDTPTADVFVHSLFARLLMLGDGFNVVPWEQRLKAFGVTGPVGDLQGAYKGYGVCNGSISDYMDLSGTVTK
ncbi:unnamed protein product [Symbiodinium microadriaticum]|nr:unnamed protein product [Symbiodinium microadriaticum]